MPPRTASTTRAPQRRTQEERSAATRGVLLDSTLECLIEYGYAGTTVARICDRAGVTRGAWMHHYPTKVDLVVAAIEHLAERRTEQIRQQIEGLTTSKDLVGDLLDTIWEAHHGPLFTATVELWVAARSEPELRGHAHVFEPMVTNKTRELDRQAFPALPAHVTASFFTAMDAVRGLLISTWGLLEDDSEARWRRAKPLLRRLFDEPKSAKKR